MGIGDMDDNGVDTEQAKIVGVLHQALAAHQARQRDIATTQTASDFLADLISPQQAYRAFRDAGYSPADIVNWARDILAGA